MKSQKYLLISILIFLLASLFFLGYNESMEKKPNRQKDWWVVYFSNPKSEDLNFVIENNGSSKDFNWKVIKNREILEEGNEVIGKEDTKNILVKDIDKSGKITVEVISDDNKKEIYRNY